MIVGEVVRWPVGTVTGQVYTPTTIIRVVSHAALAVGVVAIVVATVMVKEGGTVRNVTALENVHIAKVREDFPVRPVVLQGSVANVGEGGKSGARNVMVRGCVSIAKAKNS